MSIKRIIKTMGGGGGGGGGRGRRRSGSGGSEGGGSGGRGGIEGDLPDLPDCGKAHENCSDPSIDSYCGRIFGHLGEHKCGSCGESF